MMYFLQILNQLNQCDLDLGNKRRQRIQPVNSFIGLKRNFKGRR